jgi:hypothetical protein
MPPRSKAKAAGAAEEEAPGRPAYYVAQRDLYAGSTADVLPVAAFRAGDHVHPDVYDANPEWQQWLATPEDTEAASAAEEDNTEAPGGGADSTGGGQGEEH